MAELFYAFGRSFDYGITASSLNHFLQKFLKEESSWHCHMILIQLFFVADSEICRSCQAGVFAGGFLNGIYEICCNGFPARTDNSDYNHFSRRKAVNKRPEVRQKQMIKTYQKIWGEK